MAIYYLDASAVVKYFHAEPGTQWVRQFVDAKGEGDLSRLNQIYIANLSLAEVPAAFAILARNKQIRERVRDAMFKAFLDSIGEPFGLVNVTTDFAYIAGELTQKYPLKGYDAIQLAVALDVNQALNEQELDLIFVASDNTLLLAARAEGLAAENPHDHADAETAP